MNRRSADCAILMRVCALSLIFVLCLSSVAHAQSERFNRGDCDSDGVFSILDSLYLLNVLFSPTPPPDPICDDACDANDSGLIDLVDALYVLSAIFVDGSPLPPEPSFPVCGEDPTPDNLTCNSPTFLCTPVDETFTVDIVPTVTYSSDVHLGSPVIDDLNGDGMSEIFALGRIGLLYGYDAFGTMLPNFPISIPELIGSSDVAFNRRSEIAVGDLDNDGAKELAFLVSQFGQAENLLFVLNSDGSVHSNWSPNGVYAGNDLSPRLPSPVMCDLDNDGTLELIVMVRDGGDSLIYAYDNTGALFSPGFPADTFADYTRTTPACADINDDGFKEIVVYSQGGSFGSPFFFSLSAYDRFGFQLWSTGIENSGASPVIGNLDGVGEKEIVLSSVLGTTTAFRVFSAATGMALPSWPATAQALGFDYAITPALADVDGDALPDILAVLDTNLNAFRYDAIPASGWPVSIIGVSALSLSNHASAIAGDISASGSNEVVYYDYYNNQLHIWDFQGSPLAGSPADLTPVSLPASPLTSVVRPITPTLSDLRGDGDVELVVAVNYEVDGPTGTFAGARIIVFDFDGSYDAAVWPTLHGNNKRTGTVE